MTLDIAPLVRAIARLDEGLARYRRNEADEQLRDGLIQRFEFTYEQSHRMLKRYGVDDFLAEVIHLRDELTDRLS